MPRLLLIQMVWFRVSAVMMAVGLAASTPAAEPAPPPRPVLHYFPTEVGAKWVYHRTIHGREPDVETLMVTAVERRGRRVAVSVGRVEGEKVVPYNQVTVSGEGLFKLHPRRPVLDSGWLLRLPVEDKPRWVLGEKVYTAHGPERVVVPAGEYECVRVDERLDLDEPMPPLPRRGDPSLTRRWYAPGVGLVKSEPWSGLVQTVLKSFTPGKD